ncbi:hypothetical protein GXP67_28300 [Rhodocytophaga rosea]|uniref:DUF1440 domain-containing protein n=1 Tax=Rhodocytophaga rosea TaxID=2704465 RepID=A0A6C0GQY6_9BACT|nr:hypothetical protein [Rhodocytophaga rosea]QHT70274.1 hypothetical protein GXP67_28300 [Rhodocytophaga rosea]
MKATQVIGSGLAGAIALNILHETARRFIPQAPRMDILGMRAISKLMQKADAPPPQGEKLYWLAIAGDVISNAAYYSLTASDKPKNVWLKGALLGLGAGLGAVTLPGPMGLGTQPSGRTNNTKIMTVAWYLAGGLATAAAFQLLKRVSQK